jgi:putative transposase
MNHCQGLSHTTKDCKYDMVWIPKYREKVLFGDLRKYLGDVFRELALQKESKVLKDHLMGNHVYMLVSIPPKYAVSQVVGYIKGKSAIHIARTYAGHRHNFIGRNFWSRGYFVSYEYPGEIQQNGTGQIRVVSITYQHIILLTQP